MTAPFIKSLGLEIRGVPPLNRLAALIVLGLQADHLKTTCGYRGEGSWQQFREESKRGERPTWPDYCLAQFGFTDGAIQIYYECAAALMFRLSKKRKPAAKELLSMMRIPPSELSEARRNKLIEGIVNLAMTEGDTAKYLRKEFSAALPPGARTRRLDLKTWPSKDGGSDPMQTARVGAVMIKEAARRERARKPNEGIKGDSERQKKVLELAHLALRAHLRMHGTAKR